MSWFVRVLMYIFGYAQNSFPFGVTTRTSIACFELSVGGMTWVKVIV